MKNFCKSCVENFKSNFWLLISSIILIALNFQSKDFLCIQIFSFGLVIFAYLRINNVFGKTKNVKKVFKILSIIATIGIMYFLANKFFEKGPFISEIHNISSRNLSRLTYIAMILASFSVYSVLALLYNYLYNIFSKLLNNMTKVEKICYGIIAIILCLIVVITYFKTNAFYTQDYVYDLIFTSDIGAILRDNAFMNLYHPENDIRQPLFAVFAMPFMGVAYTLSLAFPFFYPANEAIFFAIIQVLLILFSNILIANLLKIKPRSRILFVIFSLVTYMSILYTFVLEQYVIAYFWLITCIYAICTNKQDELVLAGAGGTLLTSLLLAFWIPKEFSFKKLGKYILNLVKVGVVFGYLILLFGRLDSILPKTMKVKNEVFSSFVDKNVDEKEDIKSNKFKQYTIFIKNCFVSPKTIEITRGNIQSDYHFQAIHMENAKKYDIVGISIFVLALVGFVVSRKEKISQIAEVWIIFSLAILGFLGWGSKENGLILYILYFGWAFLTLIFQLLKYICEKIKFKYLIEIATICLIVLCVVGNYGGVKDLLKFAFKNYPANIISLN